MHLKGKGKYTTLSKEHRIENCVHIYPDGKWNNVLCEETRGYICAGPVPEEGYFPTNMI